MTELEHAWSPYELGLPSCACVAFEARNQSKYHEPVCPRWGALRMREHPDERWVFFGRDRYGWWSERVYDGVECM